MFLILSYSPYGWNMEGTGLITLILKNIMATFIIFNKVKFLPENSFPTYWLIFEINLSWSFWKRVTEDVFAIKLGCFGFYLAKNKMLCFQFEGM